MIHKQNGKNGGDKLFAEKPAPNVAVLILMQYSATTSRFQARVKSTLSQIENGVVRLKYCSVVELFLWTFLSFDNDEQWRV